MDRPRGGRSMAAVILRKELLEIFRDKRTVFSVVISPLLITPLLIALVGNVIRGRSHEERVQTYAIGIVGGEKAPSVVGALGNGANLRFEATTESEAESRVRDRSLRAALLLPADAESRFMQHREVGIRLLVDAGNEMSGNAGERVKAHLNKQSTAVVAQRLWDQGLSQELASPFKVTEKPVAGGGTRSTLLLATLLPYILVLGAIVGSVYAANDLVAGEKERGTLEALLVTPVSRRDMVLGKFLAVTCVGLVSSLLTLTGIVAPFFLPIPSLAWLAESDLRLSLVGISAMLLMQIPLAVLGSGLLLTISTWARNQKEAQSYLGPVMLVVSVLAMLSTLLPAEANRALALAPVLNAAMALKQALSGSVDPVFFAAAIAASLVYAIVAMGLAVRLFQDESVLMKA